MARSASIGPSRRAFQAAWTVAYVALPFVVIDGRSFLRLDFRDRLLHAAFLELHLDELFIPLLLVLFLTLAFVLMTLVLGRVWCGWACPQTILSDIVEWVAKNLGIFDTKKPKPGWWRKVLLHATHLGVAALAGATFLWYFITPYEFARMAARFELPAAASITWAIVTATMYADLAFVRRTFCIALCPYGRFQLTIADPASLTLRFREEERASCIDCGACVRVCPDGVDIRNGLQVECINCGRCLDACGNVLEKKGQPTLVSYSFGSPPVGVRALLNVRVALVTATTLAVGAVLVVTALRWEPLNLTIRRTAAPARTLANGRTAVFFTGVAANRSAARVVASISAADERGHPLEVRGQVKAVALEPGERRKVDFVLMAQPELGDRPVVFRLMAADGHSVETRAHLSLRELGHDG